MKPSLKQFLKLMTHIKVEVWKSQKIQIFIQIFVKTALNGRERQAATSHNIFPFHATYYLELLMTGG